MNLPSKGKWISCNIRLPEDYDVTDVNSNSVKLENEVEASWIWFDEEEEVLMAKFPGSEVRRLLFELDLLGEVEIAVSGELMDGTKFEGSDVIKVINKAEKEY